MLGQEERHEQQPPQHRHRAERQSARGTCAESALPKSHDGLPCDRRSAAAQQRDGTAERHNTVEVDRSAFDNVLEFERFCNDIGKAFGVPLRWVAGAVAGSGVEKTDWSSLISRVQE